MRIIFAIALLLFSNISICKDNPIGQIPFTINDDGLIIITLNINNHKAPNFVLDTGASGTVINRNLATRLNLQLREETFQSTGANGVVKNRRRTQKQRISLNEKIVLEEVEMSVVDLSDLGSINGIIGFDFFRNYVTETNFDTKIISFYKRKEKPDTKGYKCISFDESFCTPEIKVSVSLPNDETFTGVVLFDTGNAGSPFSFNTPFVNKYNLTSKFEKLITSESRGINSTSKNSSGVATSIKIKGFGLSEIPITLSSTKQGVSSKETYMGILGLEYISKFNFILDYNKKRIYLKPNKSFSNAFHFPLSGIGLETNENGVFIKYISEPSKAYNKGLRAGQQLISIDGAEGRDKSFYKTALKMENEEVSLVVKLENGSVKTVKILLIRLI